MPSEKRELKKEQKAQKKADKKEFERKHKQRNRTETMGAALLKAQQKRAKVAAKKAS